mmetsp:Transcript_4275/g.7945  ORF Transcript_4275/g.7945 Transcript_4275/m.7945 type:complete len:552 (-) Transcript_4275:350-2005(-)
MYLASAVALFLIQWILLLCVSRYCSDAIETADFVSPLNATVKKPSWIAMSGRSNVFFVASFSSHVATQPHRQTYQYARHLLLGTSRMQLNENAGGEHEGRDSPISLTAATSTNDTVSQNADVDISSINEAQLLLACRAYLLRKHKLEWKEKKRRAQAAASPSTNEGYFWPDPNDLLYLREDPDPYNLIYNETYGEYYGYKRNGVRFLTSQDTTYSGKNYLVDESEEPANERASTSANPFSTNPLYPSEEHVRRSNAKKKLWNNETWVKEWYNRRWAGKVATQDQKNQEKQEKALRDIPNDVLESPSFEEMTEDEVAEAIITYLTANQRKSESRKSNKDKRQIERESFREWRKQVKDEARKSKLSEPNNTLRDIVQKVLPSSNDDSLSFSPSVETMKRLKAQRSEKSKKAFQTRLANNKANPSKKIIKARRSRDEDSNDIENDDAATFDDQPEGEISPMQALLHVDTALDHNEIPSPIDVDIILKPGRLGRRRDTLRRILSECFDLRGKCVPALSGDSDSDLLFVTQCTIGELGAFVLAKLRQKIGKDWEQS